MRQSLLWLNVLVLHLGAADLAVYQDALENGFQDWSWAVRDMAATGQVHSGSVAISFEPDSWDGLYVQNTQDLSVADYDQISLYLHGGASGGQALRLVVVYYDFGQGQSNQLGDTALSAYLPGGALPTAWTEVVIPLSDMGIGPVLFNGFYLMDDSGTDQETVFVDDVFLVESGGTGPSTEISVTVDAGSGQRAINPLIYGVNAFEALGEGIPPYPLIRWGGNTTSRYAWDEDAWNVAFDWFYISYASDHPDPSQLPDGSRTDLLIDWVLQNGAEMLLTVPTIGWVARDRVRRWSYSVATYGPQEQTECTWYSQQGLTPPEWCNPDAGNGRDVNGDPITTNDPNDASKPVDSNYAADWLLHVESRVGSAATGGVKYYALDNEPMLWNSTHQDVHAAPAGYDELWADTLDYAGAIKGVDPDAQVFGPVVWGWCAYFGSAVDAADPAGGCIDGPDRQAHGGTPLLAWLLQQNQSYQSTYGLRLIDVLDIHYYPQNGTAFSNSDGDAQARFNGLKSLYHPTYVDQTWIADVVRLIPRMRELIENNCPGMQLALTEYCWGGDTSITSAVAHAEALAIYGREGLDMATRWVVPDPGTKVEEAFRLFLNYDGAGAAVIGTSIQAASQDPDAVGAYAVLHPSGDLLVLLFNKAIDNKTAVVTLAQPAASQQGEVFQFTGTSSLGPAGTVTLDGETFSLEVPGWSATLVRLPFCLTADITQHPTSRVGCIGFPLTLTVLAQGTDLHYQWLKDGVVLDGANQASLTFESLSPEDAGAYACRVQNPCGATESQTADVWVLGETTWPEMLEAWPNDADPTHDVAPLSHPDGVVNICDIVACLGCTPSTRFLRNASNSIQH